MNTPRRRLFIPLIFSVALFLLLLVALQGGRPRVGVAQTLNDLTIGARNGPCVAGPHSGAISSDESWCLADSPHLVSSDVTVNPGVTLTVEPGVVAQGQTNAQLRVQGRLLALGTLAQPIMFTSVSDSGRYQWEGLVFDGGTGHLDHTTVRYGGRNNGIAGVLYANIVVMGVLDGEVRIENSYVFSEGVGDTDYGLYIWDSHVVVSETTFSYNSYVQVGETDYALYAAGDNTVITLTHNTFSDNGSYAARVEAGHLSPVWMTDHTFVNNDENRVLIEGGTVEQDVILASQTGLDGYELRGDIGVLPGVTLTVEPDVTVRARANVELQVQGRLTAVGAPSQPIVFTAMDIGYGWDGLFFDGGTGELEGVTVSYGGSYASGAGSAGVRGNIAVVGGQLRLEGGRVSDERGGSTADYGLYAVDSQVVVSGVTFADNGSGGSSDFGLYVNGSTAITITGSSFENNDAFAIGAPAANWHQVRLAGNSFSGPGDQARRVYLGNGSLAASAALAWQTGLEGYEPDGLVVPAGMTLNVEPGVAVFARNASDVQVQGALEALGTPARPITFTADNLGTGWDGLVFDGGQGDLRHVTIGQGSGSVSSNIAVQGGGRLRLENSRVQGKFGVPGGNDYGVRVDNSQVVISGTEFSGIGSNNDDSALYATGDNAVITATKSVWQTNHKGIGVGGGRVVLSCVDVVNNGQEGIWVDAGAVSVVGSAISGNAGGGLNNASGVQASAVYNWWGDASGPSGVGPGSGDSVSSNVDYVPWLDAPVCALDLGVAKSAWPDPVYVEDPLVYTITVVNHSPAPATGVILTDELPSDVAFGSATPSQGACNATNGVVTCTLGPLAGSAHAAYADATVTLVVTPSVAAAGVITNTAIVAGQEFDPWTDNSTSTLTATVEPQVDLALAKFDQPDPAGTGMQLSYTLVVTNHGPSIATGVVLTDALPITSSLPASVTYISAIASQGTGCGQADGVVACALGDIARDATVTATILVTTSGAGVITNVASVASGEFDHDATNNVVTATTAVATADLLLAKSGEPDALRVGETLTYTFVVTNDGPLPATDVTLADTLPPSVTLPLSVTVTTATPGSCEDDVVDHAVTCDLGALDVGAVAAVTFTVQATGDGAMSNVASVTSGEYDPQPDNNAATADTTVYPVADLDVGQEAWPQPVGLGQPLTYTLTITNDGPSRVADVTLTDTLPLGVTGVSAQAGQGTCAPGGGSVVCELGVLDDQAVAVVTITVEPTAMGTLSNRAEVAGAAFDPDVENNVAIGEVTVVLAADLAVAKGDAPDPVAVGETLTYSIVVTNGGPSPDAGVWLTDSLPLSVTAVVAASSQGDCVVGGGLVVCDLGALGDQTAARVTVTLRPTAVGRLRNAVSVTGLELDPNPANNTVQAETSVGIARLAVHKSAAPLPAWVGRPLTYTLTFANDGPDAATGVTFSDTLPPSVSLALVTSSQGDCGARGVFSVSLFVCELGALPSGAGATATIVVTPTAAGLMTNTVEVRASEADPDLDDNLAWVSVRVQSGGMVYLPLVLKE